VILKGYLLEGSMGKPRHHKFDSQTSLHPCRTPSTSFQHSLYLFAPFSVISLHTPEILSPDTVFHMDFSALSKEPSHYVGNKTYFQTPDWNNIINFGESALLSSWFSSLIGIKPFRACFLTPRLTGANCVGRVGTNSLIVRRAKNMKTYISITNLGQVKDLFQLSFPWVSEEEHCNVCACQFKPIQNIFWKLEWLPGVH